MRPLPHVIHDDRHGARVTSDTSVRSCRSTLPSNTRSPRVRTVAGKRKCAGGTAPPMGESVQRGGRANMQPNPRVA
jgi:hypothetical protein